MSVAGDIVQRDGVTYVVRDGATEEIPVLDLAGYLAGEPGAREALAAELRHAQENIGFYYIVYHGIPQRVFDATFAALKRFFALPDAAKMALKIDGDMIGYVPPKSTIYETSKVNRNTKKDLNETLLINRERDPGDPAYRAGRRFTAPNKWPADLPGFRETMVAYQQAMEPLGRRMLPLYALALDKPADFFAPYFDEQS
ncbi:MAG: isopenicillin N synthase family oxygenase, partial [Alphaproteobacteria bacterium]|nr:isopenicillin N synthase family oxygenase [Alphaproteobacteria bacterium]